MHLMFLKIGVFKNFAKLTRKHLYRSLFLIFFSAILLKNRLRYRCFPVNFAKFLRAAFFTEHLWWLFLDIYHNASKIGLINFISSLRCRSNRSDLPCEKSVLNIFPRKTSQVSRFSVKIEKLT